VTRPWRRDRYDSNSDEVGGNAHEQATGEAHTRASGEARGVGRRSERSVAVLAHGGAKGVR
jgi:hypothetical protein